MVRFSPNGDYAYVCSSSSSLMHVVDAREYTLRKSVGVISPFCPYIWVSQDGQEIYFTHKDIGYISFFNATSMEVEGTVETGPTTNHLVTLDTPEGDKLLYVTVGGLNAVKVYDRSNAPALEFITQTSVGQLPHGIWSAGDDTKVYIGNENDDTVSVMETRGHSVTSVIKVGQNPQALVYVPSAISSENPRNDLAALSPTLKSTAQTIALVPTDATAALGGNVNFRGLATHEMGVSRIRNAKPGAQYYMWLTGDMELKGPSTLLAVLNTDSSGSDQKDFVVPMGSFQSTEESDAIFSRVLVVEAGGQDAVLKAQYFTTCRGGSFESCNKHCDVSVDILWEGCVSQCASLCGESNPKSDDGLTDFGIVGVTIAGVAAVGMAAGMYLKWSSTASASQKSLLGEQY
jgi:YVTN family beta-propeller protein